MKKHLALSFLLLVMLSATHGQNRAAIDGYKTAIKLSKSDSAKAFQIIKLGYEYEIAFNDSALYWYDTALELTKKNDDVRLVEIYGMASMRIGIFQARTQGPDEEVINNLNTAKGIFKQTGNQPRLADVLSTFGIYEFFKGNYLQAYKLHTQTIDVLIELKDSARLARSYNNLGMVYKNTNEIEKAISTYQKGQKISEALQDYDELARLYSNIGVLYTQIDYNEKAKEYFQLSLNAHNENTTEYDKASAYNNLGMSYLRLGDVDSAFILIEKAANIADPLELHDVEINTNINFGLIFKHRKQYDRAYEITRSALRKARLFDRKPEALICLTNLDIINIERERYSEAIIDLNKALELTDSIESVFPKIDIYTHFSNAYKGLKNYQKALEYRALEEALSDSINSADQTEALLILDYQYEKEKQEQELAKHKLLALEEHAKAESRLAEVLILIVVLLLVILSTIILFKSNKAKTAKNKQLIATNRIIVEQKTKIEEQSAALKLSNRDKVKLFSILSHDRRSPFRSLKAVLELSASGSMNQLETVEIMQRLNKSVEANLGFLEDLLLWSKGQLGGLVVTQTEIDIKKLINSSAQTFHNRMEEKEISLINEGSEDFKLTSDPELIQLVLRNLIGNAIKFSHRGGNIIIRASKTENGSKISIQDHGVGITKEKLEGIFELNHASTLGTEKEVGTGLGLTLCKEVVTKLGGTIEVESELNKGTTVIIQLPEK